MFSLIGFLGFAVAWSHVCRHIAEVLRLSVDSSTFMFNFPCSCQHSHLLVCPDRLDEADLLILPHGALSVYEKSGNFVAECDHLVGGRKCKRTRTARATKTNKGPQGRPLVFLAAFLLHVECDPDTPDAHYNMAKEFTFEQRLAARRWLQTCPGSARFFAGE